MAKKLSDVLAGTNKSRTRPGSTGTRPGVDYASKMKDERDLVASHEVQEFDDRNGNGSDVFNATNIKHAPDSKHGHIPKPEDEKQYKQANEETSVMDSSPRPMPKPMTSSLRPKKRPIITGAGSIAEPSPNGTMDGSTRGISEENEEKDMMKAQLHFIKYAADEIMGHVDASKDPEEWFQNKLSGLHAGVKDLHAYIEGDKRMKGQVKEEAEGDPRVEPKDVKSKGKSLKMIVGQVKESNDGSRTKTGTEQARARFDKKMERKEMQKEREENDN